MLDRANLCGVDLYRDARRLPYTLAGRRELRSEAELLRSGLTRRAVQWRADRGRLLRRHHGLYAVGGQGMDLLDVIRAAMAVCPAGTVVGYQTAATLLGFGVLAESTVVHVVVPAGSPVPDWRGIAAHQSVVPLGPATVVRGIPCVPPARCAVDLARTVDRLDALPVLDAALYSGAVTLDDLLLEVTLHCGLRGVIKARQLIMLSDPRAECRQESQLRLVLHDGGLTDFVPQVPVVGSNGRVRYRLDLADEGRRIAAEYDGSSHLDRARLRFDRARHNWLEAQGWRMRYFTDHDLYRRASHIVRTLRAIKDHST